MTKKKSASLITGLFLSVTLIQGCSSYDPVPVEQCGKVVKNVKKVLGKMAPSRAEMMENCETATDKQRGCALAATTTGDISRCR